ncbi:hypothetical protein THIOM_000714 [Candidatus Thiomargarita nelsonii]|uniref:Uncharacterized protein n=1 Tax=Candidatus Thiomargarita nelsonii TaxID=1003181 RepID=A0A176S604_9GAMM|nr:hypothetical protein THIOM_000714 [Candidatus Thiomargarita nelsonii]
MPGNHKELPLHAGSKGQSFMVAPARYGIGPTDPLFARFNSLIYPHFRFGPDF